MCELKYSQKNHLRRHFKTVHEGFKIKCDHCSIEFKDKDNLRNHIKAIHSGDKYNCDVCEFQTSYKSVIKKHMKTFHMEHDKAEQPGIDYNISQIIGVLHGDIHATPKVQTEK